jgi:hypothetical protein
MESTDKITKALITKAARSQGNGGDVLSAIYDEIELNRKRLNALQEGILYYTEVFFSEPSSWNSYIQIIQETPYNLFKYKYNIYLEKNENFSLKKFCMFHYF